MSILIVQLLQKRIRNTLALYGILAVTAIPGFFYCTSADYFTSTGLMIGFMAGTLLDDRYVHFENTRKPIWMEQGKRICSQTAESANERSADHEKRKEKTAVERRNQHTSY